ncbi:MAG: HisA/HisF-related TIM barrel protein [bacterium]
MPLIVPILPLMDGTVTEPDPSRPGLEICWAADHHALVVTYLQHGVEWVHFVDIDGMHAGRPVQSCLVTELAVHKETIISVEGGLRTWQDARMYLEQAVDLIYLGARDHWPPVFAGFGQPEVERRVLCEVILPATVAEDPELAVSVVRPFLHYQVVPVLTGPMSVTALVRAGNAVGVEFRRRLAVRVDREPDPADWRGALQRCGGFVQAVMIDHRHLERLGIGAAFAALAE